MAGMHHALMLASRILAGILAGIAFYFAFFLYEDEEGIWQNRLETLWIAIHDRAIITGSTSTAFLNKIAEIVTTCASRLFGEKIISTRAIAASILLSALGATVTALIVDSAFQYTLVFETTVFSPLTILVIVIGTVFFCFPAFSHRPFRRAHLLMWIPGTIIVIALLKINDEMSARATAMIDAALLLTSCASDFLALITIRKLFASIANTFSPSKLSATALTLVLISVVVTGLPLALIALVDKHPLAILGDPNATKRDLFLFTICIFNVSTALLCVAVAIFLFTALAHKIVWPVLSRLFYPLASKKILTNKKILIPAGTLALTFAFGLERVGAKEILKLFAS